MSWVKRQENAEPRNKARARVTEVGLAPAETLAVVEMEEEISAEEPVETPEEVEVEVETLAGAEETPVEAVETFKMKGTGPVSYRVGGGAVWSGVGMLASPWLEDTTPT